MSHPRLLPAFVLLSLAMAGCAASSALSVDRLDTLLTLLADGSLEVQETAVVRFGETASTSFIRRLPDTGHDGLTEIRAYIDDRLVGDAAGPERARVRTAGSQGRGADVEWTFPSIATGTRAFRLRYRAAATLAVSGSHGRFAWSVLDRRRSWPVADARVAVIAPAGASILIPAGMAEPGWRVSARPDGGVAEKSAIEAREAATASVGIAITPQSLAEPAWQFEAERAAKLVPAFAIAAVFVLVAGLGVLVMVRILAPKTRADGERAFTAASLRKAGVVLILFGGGLTWVVRYTLESFGPWAMAVPLSVALAGLLFVIAGPMLRD